MSEYSVVIGSTGVTLLLIAYFLSLFRVITQESRLYSWLNILGAFVACYASLLIDYYPFVILEAVWGIVAVIGLVRGRARRKG